MEITDLRFENGNADHEEEELEELALLFLLKEVKPSPDHKTIKLLTFDTCFCYENP